MTDENMGALAAALALAQGEMQNAAFNRKNPHFKSSYADLSAIRDAVTPALSKHGLAVVQTIDMMESGPVLRTQLVHKDGGRMFGLYPLPPNYADPQKFGSALTYARRYSLAALCNIASEEDDDANAASAPQRAQKAPGAVEQKPAASENETMRQLRASVAEIEERPDVVKGSELDELIAWAQEVSRGMVQFRAIAKLDEWEHREQTQHKLDRLMTLDRETWKAIKVRIADRRKALEPAHA